VQRRDDAAGDHQQGADGQDNGADEQHELHDQRPQRRGILRHGVVAGGVERGFGDADGGGEPTDRERGPLVRRQFRLLSGLQRVEQALAQSEILRFEIAGLGRGDSIGDRRGQLHSRCNQLQCFPRRVSTAGELGEVDLSLRRDAPGGQPQRNNERRFAGGVAQQPGDLLDRQQVVDHGVLVVDVGGERPRQFIERLQQSVGRIHIFLGKRRAARGLRLAHCIPEFLLQRHDRLEQTVELRHQCFLLRKLDAAQHAERLGHRGHFDIMQATQIFFDLRIHCVGIEQADRGGTVGAQTVHRLEQVRRGVRDRRDPAYDPEPPKTVPGVEREADHDAEGGGQDDDFQQRRYGQAIQIGCFPQSSRYLGREG
jgi:hypothetical protein